MNYSYETEGGPGFRVVERRGADMLVEWTDPEDGVTSRSWVPLDFPEDGDPAMGVPVGHQFDLPPGLPDQTRARLLNALHAGGIWSAHDLDRLGGVESARLVQTALRAAYRTDAHAVIDGIRRGEKGD